MKITDDTTLNTFNEFAGLLGTSTIGQHVRHLHLYNGDFGVPLHGVEVNLLLLISILTHLRRLRSIQISSIYWRNDSLPLTELQLPTVTGLSLTHFPHQYEMHGIPAILHIFPCLKELRVLLDCSGDYPAPTTKELPLPPELQLEALHFWSPLSEPSLIRAISTTDSIKNMRSISVEVSTELYISPIGCLLLNSGSKLKDLSLDISDTDDILSAIDTNNACELYIRDFLLSLTLIRIAAFRNSKQVHTAFGNPLVFKTARHWNPLL